MSVGVGHAKGRVQRGESCRHAWGFGAGEREVIRDKGGSKIELGIGASVKIPYLKPKGESQRRGNVGFG